MKKALFALLALVFACSLCSGFSIPVPPSAYNGEPTNVITGEVTSVFRMTFVAVNDSGYKIALNYKFGTTNSWLSPTGTLNDLQNKKLEISYFVDKDGNNVALNIRNLTPAPAQ